MTCWRHVLDNDLAAVTNHYRIVIRGRLAERYLKQYDDEFDITTTESATVLSGTIRDAAQLHGLVAHLTKAGLELVEFTSTGHNDSTPLGLN